MNVLIYGTFDYFHEGHIRLLERAKKYGENLFIGVCTDEFSLEKGKRPFFNYEERCNFIKNYPGVKKYFPQNSFLQKKEDIEKYNIDYLIAGDDWKGKNDYLNEYCKVIYLERTPNISSTMLRKNTKTIQIYLLKMMKDIHKICVDQNICYWLSAGSLLGAVRHNGFIPWDDDIDIVMPRADYEKFKKIAQSFLNTNYKILDMEKTDLKGEYLGPLMKIIDINTDVFIDINPLDKYSSNFFIRLFQKFPKIIYCGKRKAYQSIKEQITFRKKIYSIISKLFLIFSDKFIEKLLGIWEKHLNKEHYIFYSHCNKVIFKGAFLKQDIFPLKRIKFETEEFFIPNNYDRYLRNKYGEYLKLPKQKDRKTHF